MGLQGALFEIAARTLLGIAARRPRGWVGRRRPRPPSPRPRFARSTGPRGASEVPRPRGERGPGGIDRSGEFTRRTTGHERERVRMLPGPPRSGSGGGRGHGACDVGSPVGGRETRPLGGRRGGLGYDKQEGGILRLACGLTACAASSEPSEALAAASFRRFANSPFFLPLCPL